jgi:trimeric autotransporter adhesin
MTAHDQETDTESPLIVGTELPSPTQQHTCATTGDLVHAQHSRRTKMSRKNRVRLCLALSVVVAVASPSVSHALSSVFTYQGQLEQSGLPADGTCDFQFSVWDAAGSGSPPSGGGQMGSTFPVANQVVSNGLFTVELNFGDGIFTGNNRWLQIAVRCPAGSGAYTTLSPRQRLTAIPYALYTPFAGQATVAVDLGCLGCVNAGDIADGAVSNATIEPGSIGANRLSFTPGTVTEITTTDGLTGGTITTTGVIGVNFGTAAGTVAAGDHNHGDAYWRITGNSGTTAGPNFLGTTDNQALELRVNNARALRLEPNANSPNVIGGFSGNSAWSGVVGATVAGGGESGLENSVTDDFGTVGGGWNNQAGNNFGSSGDASFAAVGGGRGNAASGDHATIGGGEGNHAGGSHATAGGGRYNFANGNNSTIGGGESNSATNDATVGGGSTNHADGVRAAIGGGSGNTAGGDSAVIGGGWLNTASGEASTIGGGGGNSATAAYATIAGGARSDPGDSATGNRVTDDYGTVGGGGNNQVGNNAGPTTDATYGTVAGGGGNMASGLGATVGGGGGNQATGAYATVGGGVFNFATGEHSTVPGGVGNLASGAGSLAVGRLSFATHNGSFVWGDGTQIAGSQGVNTFNALATGGFRFYFDAVGNHCDLTSTTGWQCFVPSDRNLKTEVVPVDGADVLDRLAAMPVQTWAYKADNGAARHMGPMAQDFHAAFRLGANDREINTVDANGVALAAIQGLYRLLQEKDAQIAALSARVGVLERNGVARPQCNAEKGKSGR